MIGLEFFEEDAHEARRVLAAMSRLASERTGRTCVFSLAASLDAAQIERVMELQVDAFGAEDVAFTRRDLQEVMDDPEALFITFDVDGRMEGACFGYSEWPDQITVPGTDFFFDTAMVSTAYRGNGIGKMAIAGVLLLADLLDCQRVGIAAWMHSPCSRKLLRFYRHFGFARIMGGKGPHAKMSLALDDTKLARCLAELELSPEGRRMPMPRRLWPAADERALLGRFYLAMGLATALYVVAPFEFAYLYLVMDRPDWAVVATLAGFAAATVAAIPGGLIADQRGRKAATIAGGLLTGLGLAAVPFAVGPSGSRQLIAACAAFAVAGIGQTILSGAAEAWVVDNLQAAGRPDLTETFYGRVRSVSAAGAAVAGTLALALLLGMHVDRGVLDLLWYVGGAGFIAAALFAATITERKLPEHDTDAGTWPLVRDAFTALAGRRALIMIVGAIILGSASGAASQEAFTVALITKQFDARLFAPLSIVDSLMGVLGPILGIAVARRMGATRMLALGLALEAIAAAVLFVHSGVATLVVLYVVLDLLDDAWDPVALARLQALTPSSHRATITSMAYQLSSAGELLAVAAFGLMLGKNREALEKATPDLLEAFSGKARPVPQLPVAWLGLPVGDLAIVVFVGVAAAAIPLVLASKNGSRGSHVNVQPPRARDSAPSEPALSSHAAP